METRRQLPITLLLILLIASPATAQWAVDGNPVCTATGAQDHVRAAANGLGGAVLVWQDNRGASVDIYARQIGFLGPAEWTSNGVALCTATGGQLSPQVVHDGFGYLLYTWEDYRSGTADLYAAITDRLGNVFTAPDGFAISTAAGAQQYAALTTNSFGMGYVAWSDARSGGNRLYAQAFNVFTPNFWTAGGLPVCTFASEQLFPAVAPDATDGLFVVWEDWRNGNLDIFAQHVNVSGQLLWAANGGGVCVHPAAQTNAMVVSDGSGGIILAWHDQRHGVFIGAIYAQHISSAGSPLWPTNGIPLAISTDSIILPKMIPDGAGGAILAWQDGRDIGTNGGDVYAQRVNSSGTVLWGANGSAVCTAPFDQTAVELAPDGANGAIVSWTDVRALSTADVYAQRMNSSGTPVWTPNGMPICTASSNQLASSITSEAGATILAWEDQRGTGAVANVYAQRIDIATGLIGHPQPYITSIVDVPNDEGGQVRITLLPGDGQAIGEEFEVFDQEYHGGDLVYVGTWDGSPSYTFDVLTEGVGVPNHYYVAGTFTSNVAEGTSYDNLAPPAPTLTGQRVGANVNLQWNSTAADIAYFVIQRSDLGDWTVTGLSTTDLNVPPTELHYRMHAVDIHGNSGPHSNPLDLPNPTGVSEISLGPQVLAVLPNSPNPFRGSTTFRFGMPNAGPVKLELYDALGRRVTSRHLGLFPSGWGNLVFDGRDDGGRLLASGVYFCRITAAGETQTKKVVVQR